MFVDFHKLLIGSRRVHIGNHDVAGVLGIHTYKLDFTEGKTILIEDVLYVLSIRRNLLSVFTFHELVIVLTFSKNLL